MKKNIFCLFLCLSVLSFAEDFEDFEQEFSFEVYDPLRGYNEVMTSFNLGFYKYVARPVSKAYGYVTPDFVRYGVRNFTSNILMPLRFINNALQFKFKEAGTELKRFGVNVVFGFFGFIDAASKTNIPKYPADFGTTLAHLGVGSGFHLVLPFLGPSNLRDTLSLPINWYSSPTGYIDPFLLSVGVNSYIIMNDMSFELDTFDEIYFNTPNIYPFLRDAYEKRRIEMSK
ncbi:MlaA family lipoprotein [Campylobacter sp. MIT 97-5078]|uniref:MlaA family lipoprotein n=1 Tax=Campylobacter sp. MIT 97-5078 TaxID=1548153 RepID=UPI000513DDD7|nr:MlaA family lipoprotein [Campylobacter sp. MIT 97-5078]KGI55731.1 hypothetical protein LR59_10730 [Campylobacter sp. MIT 97-5078]TQR27166.1 VacJ family lipoprotein [Campylobacter sp. MIT 97-5078]